MEKPDFGRGGLSVVHWTKERIDYLAYLAGKGMSAGDIAAEIGVTGGNVPARIRAVCRRYGITLSNKGGRPSREGSRTLVMIEIDPAHLALMTKIAARHNARPKDLMRRLHKAVLDQGEAFIENMLDLEVPAP